MYYWWDPTYILVVIGAIICLIASARVKTTYAKYSKYRSMSGMTGAQAAQRILNAAGIYDVEIRHISGNLTDHYDPRNKTLSLSDSVYGSTSVAAVGVAAVAEAAVLVLLASLVEAGAVEVYASCTHPVLSGPAMDNIQKSAIKKLVVLDTIYLPEDRLIDKIEQISIAKLLAEAIVRIHENRPLSPLFEIGNAKKC